jgi:hypothetical protein
MFLHHNLQTALLQNRAFFYADRATDIEKKIIRYQRCHQRIIGTSTR